MKNLLFVVLSVEKAVLSVKKFLTRISAIELLGRKGERPGYSAALFYVPERIMAAKGKRYLSIAPKNHNNMNHMAIVKIKDATHVIAPLLLLATYSFLCPRSFPFFLPGLCAFTDFRTGKSRKHGRRKPLADDMKCIRPFPDM